MPSSLQSTHADRLASWRRFVEERGIDAVVRPVILASWQRCRAAGVQPQPSDVVLRRVPDEELERRLTANAELLELARPHLEWLSLTFAASPHAAYVVDRDGVVLHAIGTDRDAMRADGLVPGYDWSEAMMGTNGAGTAIAAGEPVLVEGAEHFAEPWHGHTCTGAPLRGPGGEVVGAIDLSTAVIPGAPERLITVAHAAYAISQELRYRDSLLRTSGELAAERRHAEEVAHNLAVEQSLRAAAEVARQAAELHRLLVASVEDYAIFALDGDGQVLTWNAGAARLKGYSGPEVLGRNVSMFYAPEDVDAGRPAADLRAAATEGRFKSEGWRVRQDGSRIWSSVVVTALRGEGGELVGFAKVTRDLTERLRTEELLRASEERFRGAFDHAAVGIGVTDPDGNFLQANRAFCEMLGYTQAELRRLDRVEITHPDDRMAQTKQTRRLLSGETRSHTMEKRYLTRDGRTVWGRATVSVIRDATGAPQNLIAVIEDISERVRAEEARSESERRYAHVAANVPGVVYQFVYRPDGSKGYTYVSESARRLLGVAPDDVLRDSDVMLDLVHPEDRAHLVAHARAAAEALSPVSWEGRVLLASGEERFIQVAARDQQLPDGSIASDGLIMDVTDLRRATRRLEESEQRYRSLFEHNPDAVFSLDCEGRFVSVNGACETVSGYPSRELVGMPFAPLILADELPATRANFDAAVAGRAVSYETTVWHASGNQLRLAITNLPIIIDGRVVGVFGIAKDLTAHRALETQLRQSQKMEAVGLLAGGVAHDFNNILTVIQSYSSFAAEELPESAPARADLAEVRAAADRAASLTRQLLAFSRRQVLKPQCLDLNVVVTGLSGMLRRLIGEDIRIDTSFTPTACTVHADPGQLEQVILNLALNARDAMPHGGILRIRTRTGPMDLSATQARPELAPGEYAALVFEDTGVGMDPATLSRIFEPFYTTKGPGKGTGLGLATVYGIVQQSGGVISVESSPGAGSRFTVLLPCVQAVGTADGVAAAAPPPPRGSEVILLVEDEPTVRAAVLRQLERQGYTVREAANATQAIEIALAPEARIDLVLTDVVMPDLNGRALGEQLAKVHPGLRVVYMSGYTDDEMLRRGLRTPGTAYLEKPFTHERLAAVVREALDGASSA